MDRSPSKRSAAGMSIVLSLAIGQLSAGAAHGHFLWIRAEPSTTAKGGATIRVFLNEEPEPGGPEFLKFVRDVVPTAGGLPLATAPSEASLDAPWAGKLPAVIDAERDLGVKTKGDMSYRLYYTARAQTVAADLETKEKGGKLRVRLGSKAGAPVVQVLFDGEPAAGARIKAYPESGDPVELAADDRGLATVPGVAEGKAALWANWVESRPGEVAGKAFSETRHYATLTFHPAASTSDDARPPTAVATMPDPAVNSFGAAVLGDWLYVYSGHAGVTHEYSVETTSRHFRRLNLKDRATWEELPMGRDVQGVALVSDGKAVYRIGGMSARNEAGKEHDLHSSADFARFDPGSKAWADLAPLPEPRSTHDAAVIGRKIYVVGGWSMKGSGATPAYLSDALVFDLDAPDLGWKSIDQPFRRRALSAAEAGGKLYVLGGLTDSFKIERRVDVYDPSTGSWSRGPSVPALGDREGFATSCFSVAGRLYYSGLAGTIARLDDRGLAWEAVGAWSLPRNTHRLLAAPDGALLAVGGNFQGKQTPVIESVSFGPGGAQGAPTGR